MNLALWKKNLGESKWLFLCCAAGMFAFCWARMWIISRFDAGRFKAMLELIPESWQKLSAVDFDWMATYAGRVAITFDEPIVVLCATVWAVTRGSDVISGEIGRGTMEMLLSQPVSRTNILFTHTAVTTLGALALALIAWLGIYVGVQTTSVVEYVQPSVFKVPGVVDIPNPFAEPVEIHPPFSEKLSTGVFFIGVVNLFCLTVALHAITVFVSSWDRYRWRTIGIFVGFYVLSIMVKLLGMSSESMLWAKAFSVFTAYEPQAFVNVADARPHVLWQWWETDSAGRFLNLTPYVWSAILLILAGVCYLVSTVIFVRRDIPSPL